MGRAGGDLGRVGVIWKKTRRDLGRAGVIWEEKEWIWVEKEGSGKSRNCLGRESIWEVKDPGRAGGIWEEKEWIWEEKEGSGKSRRKRAGVI